jgi:hypothetical protein
MAWKKMPDADSGYEYFYNTRTGESRWDEPDGFKEEDEEKEEEEKEDKEELGAMRGLGLQDEDEEWLPENIDDIDDGVLQQRLAAVGMQELLEISTKEVTDVQDKNKELEKDLKRLRQQDAVHTQGQALREAFRRWKGGPARSEQQSEDDDDDDNDSFLSGAIFGGIIAALVGAALYSFSSAGQDNEYSSSSQRTQKTALYRTKDLPFANHNVLAEIMTYVLTTLVTVLVNILSSPHTTHTLTPPTHPHTYSHTLTPPIHPPTHSLHPPTHSLYPPITLCRYTTHIHLPFIAYVTTHEASWTMLAVYFIETLEWINSAFRCAWCIAYGV